MNEKELRAQVAEKINREDVPDTAWEVVQNQLLVEDALIVGDENTEKKLVKAVTALLPFADLMTGTPSVERESKAPKGLRAQLGEQERVRAKAIGAGNAHRATLDNRVIDFRKRVLGGELLKPDAAKRFIESVAPACFPISWFEEQGVPVTDHYSDVSYKELIYDSQEDEERDVCFTEVEYISVQPPGKDFKASLPKGVRLLELPQVKLVCRPAEEVSRGSEVAQRQYQQKVYPGSVLDDLRILSKQLVEEYCRPLEEADVTCFILTGIANLPRVLTGEVEGYYGGLSAGKITLSIDSCVSPETVRKFYASLQLDLLDKDRTSRHPAKRNIEVYSFVADQCKEVVTEFSLSQKGEKETIDLPVWRELMERWNASNPQKSYTNVSQFYRDYYRGLDVVLQDRDYSLGRPSYRRSIP